MSSTPIVYTSFASVWRRIAAYVIDYAILFAVLIPMQGLIWIAGNGFPYTLFKIGLQVELWVLLSISLPAWMYFSISEQSIRKATLGKRIFRLEVTRIDGSKIGFGRAIMRTAIKLLPWELTHITLLLPVPIWWAAPSQFPFGLIIVYTLVGIYIITMFLNQRMQSVDDIFAQTVVKYIKN